MRVGIVGSRRRNEESDLQAVRQAVLKLTNVDLIVSGGCRKGGDKFAEIIADETKIPIKIFYPNWTLGRHAGFLRNTDIARESDILIACVSQDRTGGTEDTIIKYEKFSGKKAILV